jgi:hypothetical protein
MKSPLIYNPDSCCNNNGNFEGTVGADSIGYEAVGAFYTGFGIEAYYYYI